MEEGSGLDRGWGEGKGGEGREGGWTGGGRMKEGDVFLDPLLT